MLQAFLSSSAELGALYGLVALSVAISFRFLKFPDLTPDGSFVLGAALSAKATLAGFSPLSALIVGSLGGVTAGIATGCIHRLFGVNKFFAGILTTMFLYTVNLRLLERANISTFGRDSFFSIQSFPDTVLAIGVTIFAAVVAVGLFCTSPGLFLRGLGVNPQALKVSKFTHLVALSCGLGIANGFAGLAGALVGQYQSFADLNMGFGVTINGFAALFLGEAMLVAGMQVVGVEWSKVVVSRIGGSLVVVGQVIAAFVGCYLLHLVVVGALYAGLAPSDLRAVTATLFLIAISFRGRRESLLLAPASRFEK